MVATLDSSNGSQLALPGVIGVGPPRCGTTWADAVLRGHVGLPRGLKETRFFTENYAKGLRWYAEWFEGYPAGMPLGEICPAYFASGDARERIKRHIPGCRVIVMLRDPAERAYSAYKLLRSRGWTRLSFEEALQAEFPKLTETNRYAYHLGAWQEEFGRDNVLILFFDEMKSNPQAWLDQACDFIGIARISMAESRAATRKSIRNEIKETPRSTLLAQRGRRLRRWLDAQRMFRTARFLGRLGFWKLCFRGGPEFVAPSPEAWARTREFFRPEVEALEQLLGRDLSQWKRP